MSLWIKMADGSYLLPETLTRVYFDGENIAVYSDGAKQLLAKEVSPECGKAVLQEFGQVVHRMRADSNSVWEAPANIDAWCFQHAKDAPEAKRWSEKVEGERKQQEAEQAAQIAAMQERKAEAEKVRAAALRAEVEHHPYFRRPAGEQ
jgi:hypothetical protein